MTAHQRFRRMDIRDPCRFVVVLVDRDGVEFEVAGWPSLVWLKARAALEEQAKRSVRGTKRRGG